MLTINDYQVMAAKEEWAIANKNRALDEKDKLRLIRKTYNRLTPIAKQGHVEAQLFLGAFCLSDIPEEQEINKQWLLMAADAGNIEACYIVAVRFFYGSDGFENHIERAAFFLAISLRSNNTAVLSRFQSRFSALSSDPKINRYHEEFSSEDGSRLNMMAEELQKLDINLIEQLTRKLDYQNEKLSTDEQDFLLAAKEGNLADVLKYLTAGGNPFIKDRQNSSRTALHEAVNRGHEAIVKALLKYYQEHDFPVDSLEWEREDSPLSYAYLSKNVNLIKILLEAGANPYRKHSTKGYTLFERKIPPIDQSLNALKEYTKFSNISARFKKNNIIYDVNINFGSYGSKKENFVGSIRITSGTWPLTTDYNILLAAINVYLKEKAIPLLAGDDDGFPVPGITIRITAIQAFHLLEYIESDAAIQPNIRFEGVDNSDPNIAMQMMKNRCYWEFNPSLFSLCIQRINADSELKKQFNTEIRDKINMLHVPDFESHIHRTFLGK